MNGMSGGTGRAHQAALYTGICQYVKLAKSFDAALVFYEHGTLPSVEIALIDGSKSDYNVVRVAETRPSRAWRASRPSASRPARGRRPRRRRSRGVISCSTATKAGSALAI